MDYDINVIVYDAEGVPTDWDFFVDYSTSEEEAVAKAKKIRKVSDLKDYNFMESLVNGFNPEDGEYLQIEVSSSRELDDDENESGENYEYGPVVYECKLINE